MTGLCVELKLYNDYAIKIKKRYINFKSLHAVGGFVYSITIISNHFDSHLGCVCTSTPLFEAAGENAAAYPCDSWQKSVEDLHRNGLDSPVSSCRLSVQVLKKVIN